ncbi:phosphoethanolamine transferase [Phaeovulum sp.]|uniref:phosphoethanolamine transferase n=1 Tax=Phaeovulum sp. TaxID=2934796 RepID=UPI0039E53ABF
MTDPATKPAAHWRLARPTLGHTTLNLIIASYIMAVLNTGFWARVVDALPDSRLQQGLMGVAFWALTILFLELLGPWRLQKPVAAVLLIIAASAQYYERTFGVLIDRDMVRNIFETTVTESRHLMTGGALAQIALTGVLPALLIFWPKVRRPKVWHLIWRWPLGITVSLALLIGALGVDYKAFSAVLRERHDLSSAYQPGASVVAAVRFAREEWGGPDPIARPLGRDAHPGQALAGAKQPVLLVVFVGETARAQNFGLDGYERDTTPGLRARNVINFSDASSCGTSTAVSLPCMFSRLPQADYSRSAFLAEENLLDVLDHAGFAVEWFDNNTGDQRIATRTGWQRVDAALNPDACSVECTDEVFLPLIQDRLDTITQNTVLVLHMIGSHGPAYHLRVAPERALFQPACETAQFSDCTPEQIVNAYDNTILETDFVLSQAIDMMAASDRVLPAMLYMSDHGESLGENGLYLHAAPRFMAPAVQTRVPFVMWLDDDFAAALAMDETCLADAANQSVSQDNFFHSVLGLLDITTAARSESLNLTYDCRTRPVQS